MNTVSARTSGTSLRMDRLAFRSGPVRAHRDPARPGWYRLGKRAVLVGTRQLRYINLAFGCAA